MQISNDTRSHYERIGGEAKVRQLVQRFYQLMEELPESYGIRKLHPADLKTSEEKLFMFLSGWMGGPNCSSKNSAIRVCASGTSTLPSAMPSATSGCCA